MPPWAYPENEIYLSLGPQLVRVNAAAMTEIRKYVLLIIVLIVILANYLYKGKGFEIKCLYLQDYMF